MNEIVLTRVEPGDTLSEIAARYGVTVEELQRWNGIDDPDLVQAGQRIAVFGPADLAESTAEGSAFTSAPASDFQPAWLNGWFGVLLLVVLALFLLGRRRGAARSARLRIGPSRAARHTVSRYRRAPARAPLFRRLLSTPENRGERNVRQRLQARYPHWTLFNDLLLPSAHGTTQIDHILLSPAGLFVIETKDMSGWILGGPVQKQWTQSFPAGRLARRAGRRSTQYRFYNPLSQNQGHANALIDLGIAEWPWLRPVVVFVGEAELKTAHEFPDIDAQEDMASRFRNWRTRGVLCFGLAELERYIAFSMNAPSNPHLTPQDLEAVTVAIRSLAIPPSAEASARHNERARAARESAQH